MPPLINNIIRASIGDLLTYRFPQSDTKLACGGTLQIINYPSEEDHIIIQSVVDDLKSTSTGKPGIGFWESISKKLQQSKPD